MDEIHRESFWEFAKKCREEVRSWPEWKQRAAASAFSEPHISELQTEKAEAWKRAFDAETELGELQEELRLARERVAAAEKRAEEAEQRVEWFEEAVREHLPEYVLDDGEDPPNEANELERIDYAGDELRRAKAERDRLREAAKALLDDVRRRYPGEALRCQYMRALDDALRGEATDGE